MLAVISLLLIPSLSQRINYLRQATWGADCLSDSSSPANFNDDQAQVVHEGDGYKALAFDYPVISDWTSSKDVNAISLSNLKGTFKGATKDNRVEETNSLIAISFATPSEHMLNGNSFPLEMQIAHQGSNYAVVSVWYEVSDTRSPLLDAIKDLKPIDLQAELGSKGSDYFFYDGTFTGPPCPSGVHWFVLAKPSQATQDQIDYFKPAWFKNVGRGNNKDVISMNGHSYNHFQSEFSSFLEL